MERTESKKSPIQVWTEPLDLAWSNPDENFKRIEQCLIKCTSTSIKGVPALVIFPELSLTGFVLDNPHKNALDSESPIITKLLDLSKKYSVSLVVGFPEANHLSGKPFNSLMLCDEHGRDLGRYRKMNLFPVGKPAESDNYCPGSSGRIITWHGWKIGLSICFDLRFPRLYEAYAREAADLIITPACWVGGPTKAQQFQTLITAYGILCRSFSIGINRSGKDPHSNYEGDSCIQSPSGMSIEKNKEGWALLDPALITHAKKLSVRHKAWTEEITVNTEPSTHSQIRNPYGGKSDALSISWNQQNLKP